MGGCKSKRRMVKCDARIRTMTSEGRRILAHMVNSYGTNGGPWCDRDNVIGLTPAAVNATMQKAGTPDGFTPGSRCHRELTRIRFELGV